MAKYKQKGFNAGEGTGSSKKIERAKRYPDYDEPDKVVTYSDVFSMKTPTGPYSTAKGDLMSGRGAGLGEFGRTDTKIGEYNEDTGKQRVYEGMKGSVVGRDIDRANKGMKPYPERNPRESNFEFEQRVRRASKVDTGPETGPKIESNMPDVDVREEKGLSRKELRQQRRAQRQAERQAKREERRKNRLAAREARRARRRA
tara:strand:+ start:394 stop:996 length:603 start_codon:yes stop_codon:yes gene_type:complete